MKISTLARHGREGVRSIVRNGWMSFASISAISISLFILGVFLLMAMNMNQWAAQLESQVVIRAYLEVKVPQETVDTLESKIREMPEVSKVEFVSKEEGLEQLREKLGEQGQELLAGQDGENNPLPDSFTVEVFDPQGVAAVAAKIEKLNEGRDPPPIVKIQYGQGLIENLFRITNIVRNIGLIIVGALAFTAMFLIANTIKLTIVARRKEISIMKLVGATNAFIRWPFFIEGALLGIVGALIPTGILLYGYYHLILLSVSQIEVFITLLPLQQVGWLTAGLLVGIGFVIGIWGSMLSVRKFLRV
ncbi:permease-like cell division protein FtsX [Paenibacillus turpanensis]|uniref:permease-like cell division protein FtsX n=1 Tax=Paenibacillus turpanensis TaxID=2689078 RepID=UPI00140A742A|nr:permease-like cell division protein FtsX [Paenibacillus turpanensis]